MTTAYPTSLDDFANPNAANSLVGHAKQHDDLNDAVEAIQRKLGTDGSQDAASIDALLKSGISPGHRHTEGEIDGLSVIVGPKGDRGDDGPGGHSITVTLSVLPPSSPSLGDVWLIP